MRIEFAFCQFKSALTTRYSGRGGLVGSLLNDSNTLGPGMRIVLESSADYKLMNANYLKLRPGTWQMLLCM